MTKLSQIEHYYRDSYDGSTCEISRQWYEEAKEKLAAYEDAEEEGRMGIAKYPVGTKLCLIKLTGTIGDKCKECGRTQYSHRWVFDTDECEIHGWKVIDGCVTYRIWRPWVYMESVPESDIGRVYFLTREAAEAALSASKAGEAG